MSISHGLLVLVLAAFALQGAAAQPVPALPAAPESVERPARELLNSERIEQRFGSYGIEVLHSDERVRVSDLHSGSGDARVTRTFAVVFYPPTVAARFAAEHAEILAGGSIGAVFTRNGWTVTKRHLHFGAVDATPTVRALMHAPAGQRLAVHVYVLSVSKQAAAFDYAAIAEVHHPDYLQLTDLAQIYNLAEAASPGDDELVERILDAVAVQMR